MDVESEDGVESPNDIGYEDRWKIFQQIFINWAMKVQQMEDSFSKFTQLANQHSREEFAPLVQVVQNNFIEIESSKREAEKFMGLMGDQLAQQNRKSEWLYAELQKCHQCLKEMAQEIMTTRGLVQNQVEGLTARTSEWENRITYLQQGMVKLEGTCVALGGQMGQVGERVGEWENKMHGIHVLYEARLEAVEGSIRGMREQLIQGCGKTDVDSAQLVAMTMGCTQLEGKINLLGEQVKHLEGTIQVERESRGQLHASHDQFYQEYFASTERNLRDVRQLQAQFGNCHKEVEGIKDKVLVQSLLEARTPPPPCTTVSYAS